MSTIINPKTKIYTDGNISGNGTYENPIVLKNDIATSTVTASVGFSGSGANLTNLSGSNWGPNNSFSTDVRRQLSAGPGLVYDSANGVFSLSSTSGREVNTGTTTSLTASTELFIACSGSTTGSIVNVQLPLISSVGNGKQYIIKNIGVGTINIIASGSNKIDGAPSASIYTTYSSYSLFGSGSNWWLY